MATAEDVIRIAQGEIGSTNGAKYFNELGEADLGAWCVAFVRWVMWKAGAEFPWHQWWAWDWADTESTIAPRDLRPGDALSFDWDTDGKGDHVGIVKSVHDWGCVTIEGNTSYGVCKEQQRVWENIICGIRPTLTKAEQVPGEPKNDVGLAYRAHSQDVGWLAPVRDGQTAGITGHSLRCEAIKITPPEGVVLDCFAHVQDVGTLGYPGIRKGQGSGTGSSDTDPIIGTVGKSKRLEALMLRCVENPAGKRLRVQAHVQDVGWQEPVGEGEWAGTRGKGKRLEAIRVWFE